MGNSEKKTAQKTCKKNKILISDSNIYSKNFIGNKTDNSIMLPSILRSQSRTFSVARPLLAKKSKETLPKEPKKKTVIIEAGAKKNKVKIDEKLTKVESTHALIAEIETRKKTKELEISEEKTQFSQLNPKAMTVVDLKRELKLRGLKVSGLKAQLTTRLKDALEV